MFGKHGTRTVYLITKIDTTSYSYSDRKAVIDIALNTRDREPFRLYVSWYEIQIKDGLLFVIE